MDNYVRNIQVVQVIYRWTVGKIIYLNKLENESYRIRAWVWIWGLTKSHCLVPDQGPQPSSGCVLTQDSQVTKSLPNQWMQMWWGKKLPRHFAAQCCHLLSVHHSLNESPLHLNALHSRWMWFSYMVLLFAQAIPKENSVQSFLRKHQKVSQGKRK